MTTSKKYLSKNLQKAMDELRNIQTERNSLLRIFYRDKKLVAGSYAEVLVRCGKRTCHCHKEGGHYATRLSRWVNGKLKTKIVCVADRGWVKRASDQYKTHKNALKKLRALHKIELKILNRIIKMKTIDYG
jgi:hypothetical protein